MDRLGTMFMAGDPEALMPSNRSVETDTQRLGAAKRSGERAPRGTKPLRAAHLQR